MDRDILLVEDDPEIISMLKENLGYEGYSLMVARDGETGLQKARNHDFGVILLDWMLPEMSGIEMVRRLREENIDTPVIMITARHEDVDKVEGLEAGCDDYITKPFSISELVARIKAARRRYTYKEVDTRDTMPRIQRGDILIELDTHRVFVKGKEVYLTATEFKLLTLLARQPGRVYSRKQLLDLVWDYTFKGYQNTVNTHINRLRSKIEENPAQPKYVLTVWGVGYKFTDTLEG